MNTPPTTDTPSITTITYDVIATLAGIPLAAAAAVYTNDGSEEGTADSDSTAIATTTTTTASRGIININNNSRISIGNIIGNGTNDLPAVSLPPKIDIMRMGYEQFHNINLSTEEWYNYTCQRYQPPSGFFKDVLEPGITVSGIIGIILTMIVLSRKTMVNSTNCYLTALAVADLICLLLLSTRIIVANIADCEFSIGSENSIFNHYDVIFMEVFSYTSIGVTVMLAVERYIAICQPMQAMSICTVKRARIIIVIIFAIAFILCVPKFFEMEISYRRTKGGDSILMATWVLPYNEQVYVCLVQAFLVTILPFFCLLALNIRLIVEIKRSTRYLQVCLGADWQMRSVVTREEIKITMMLISVVVAFFVCQAPFMVYNLIISLLKYDVVENPMLTNEKLMESFKHMVQCMLALKSSCNFILYCWFSEKFWTTFKRLFCLHHCLPRQGTNHVNGCSNNNSHNNSHNHNHRPSCYITRETTC